MSPDKDMLLQIDTSGLIDHAAKVQPGDNSGYTFAVILLSVVVLISWAVTAYLYRRLDSKIDVLQKENDTLRDSMLTKVEATAIKNTELLVSVVAYFEKITHDTALIIPSIKTESDACSARLKDHIDRICRQIQIDEKISTNGNYQR